MRHCGKTWLAIAGVFAVFLATGVEAQRAALKQRQEILHNFGEAVKEPGAMLRQESAFDLAVVQASLQVIIDGAPKLKALFPDDSKEPEPGGYTEAMPTVWEKKAEFVKLFDRITADAVAAKAAIKDEASFRAEWGKVSSSCRACHKYYRVLPKS